MTLDIMEFEKALREADLKALEDYRKGTAEAPVLYKPTGYAKEMVSGQPQVFVASEESEDRFGDVIDVAGWQLNEYKKNPVFMFGHDHSIAPIGSVARIWTEGKQLLSMVKWDASDPFAAFIQGKYERGFMRAVSVGFRALDFEELSGEPSEMCGRNPIRFKSVELLELSGVSVPAHPHALMKAMAGRKFSIIVPDLASIVPAKVEPEPKAEPAPLEKQKAIEPEVPAAEVVVKTIEAALNAVKAAIAEMEAKLPAKAEETPKPEVTGNDGEEDYSELLAAFKEIQA